MLALSLFFCHYPKHSLQNYFSLISTFFSSLKAAFAALNRALCATIFFSLFHFSLSGSLFYETVKITFSRRILRRQRRIFFSNVICVVGWTDRFVWQDRNWRFVPVRFSRGNPEIFGCSGHQVFKSLDGEIIFKASTIPRFALLTSEAMSAWALPL